jgi:GH15 family glucan-1,4-alpha-glucosidase
MEVIMTEAAIADHCLIGDLHTAALVSTAGSIDWFCCPRFDPIGSPVPPS